MAEAGEKQWYVLHTYSGYENKVKENLESRANQWVWKITFSVQLFLKKKKQK